jgi:hypothetical protein
MKKTSERTFRTFASSKVPYKLKTKRANRWSRGGVTLSLHSAPPRDDGI